MLTPLLLIEKHDGSFRQYKTIHMFCIELSKMTAAKRNGGEYKISIFLPFDAPALNEVDVALLQLWLEGNVRGPDFPRGPGGYMEPEWAIDEAVRKSWLKEAERELRAIIGHYFR